jgi:hypothetical protein
MPIYSSFSVGTDYPSWLQSTFSSSGSHIAASILQISALEEVKKRAPPEPSEKAPPKVPEKTPAKPPTTLPAQTPAKPPVPPTPKISSFVDLLINREHRLPYLVKQKIFALTSSVVKSSLRQHLKSLDSERGNSRRGDGRLVKRSRTVKACDGRFTPKAASYYHTFKIYANFRSNNPKAVFKFQTNLIARRGGT